MCLFFCYFGEWKFDGNDLDCNFWTLCRKLLQNASNALRDLVVILVGEREFELIEHLVISGTNHTVLHRKRCPSGPTKWLNAVSYVTCYYNSIFSFTFFVCYFCNCLFMMNRISAGDSNTIASLRHTNTEIQNSVIIKCVQNWNVINKCSVFVVQRLWRNYWISEVPKAFLIWTHTPTTFSKSFKWLSQSLALYVSNHRRERVGRKSIIPSSIYLFE